VLSIIIPVYNGASVLPKFWARLKPVIDQLSCGCEVIFIDDGSFDESLELLKAICSGESNAAWISLAENRGQQTAVLCGLRHSRGDWLLTIDDDLQHPPEFIPILLDKALSGSFDAVYAVAEKGTANTGGRVRDGFFSILLGKPAGLRIGSYRIFSRTAAGHIANAGGRFVYISAELFGGDFRVSSIGYPSPAEPAAQSLPSRYGTMRRLKLYLTLVLWYTPVIKQITGGLFGRKNHQYDISCTGGFL